ncbi:MAG: molybdenum cofactor guanylyltransferase [Spirochaetaceae bacterium]|nr:molybdenum cofactor guanylyltransferase [Spirochaetaceae bacterium]
MDRMGDCRVTLVMLAGGKSRRFEGADKQEWLLNGQALGTTIARNLLGARLSVNGQAEVLVIGGSRRLYGDLPVEIAPDKFSGCGPLGGLHAALSCSRTEWIYLVACDMPFFMDSWLEYLIDIAFEAPRPGPVAILAQAGPHVEPFHALYSKSMLPRLEQCLAGAAGRASLPSFAGFLAGLPCCRVPESRVRDFSPDWRLFININTRRDAEELLPVPLGLP